MPNPSSTASLNSTRNGRFTAGRIQAAWDAVKRIGRGKGQLLRDDQAAVYLGVAHSTMQAWAVESCPYKKKGACLEYETRAPFGFDIRYYHKSELDDVIRGRAAFPKTVDTDCYTLQ